MNKAIRFHWRLPNPGEGFTPSGKVKEPNREIMGLPDLEAQLEFCLLAEKIGIDSLLTAFSHNMPDPFPHITALGMGAKKIKFLLAYRPGLLSPTSFVQLVNTVSTILDGRIHLNIVAGHSPKEPMYYGDNLSHDERYHRADEYLEICHNFWANEGPVDFDGKYYKIKDGQLGTPFKGLKLNHPEIFLGGSSGMAQQVMSKHANCWLMLGGKTPEELKPILAPALLQGKDAGLRLNLIIKPTREEALQEAEDLISDMKSDWIEKNYAKGSDSQSHNKLFNTEEAKNQDWITPYLWKGAVKYYGVSSVALVGTPEEIAEAIMAYKEVGISHFIFSGWPNKETLITFGEEVQPLVRKLEEAAKMAVNA
ncbi:MAG: LLM class flavin-dependent oxidoreductase [Flavobacteriales bacterium]|nr:LLM class flavin-dependent oxidoreductase [Flavobacteriales bacterium]